VTGSGGPEGRHTFRLTIRYYRYSTNRKGHTVLFLITILITNIDRIAEQQWAIQQAQAARWAAQASYDGVWRGPWTE